MKRKVIAAAAAAAVLGAVAVAVKKIRKAV